MAKKEQTVPVQRKQSAVSYKYSRPSASAGRKYMPNVFNHLLWLTRRTIILRMKRTGFLLVVILLSISAFAQAIKRKGAAPSPASANVFALQEGYVDANGVLIFYQTIGQGAPLMIVHGGPGASHDYLMPYLLPLVRGNKLIFIDERGSGRSEKLEDTAQYTVENMVEDVESVRQALHLGKISLMGHSFGGVLAQAYAFKYQQNLTHLI